MEIKDFIKEALLQIVDGVTSANDELKSKGAYIPTNNLIGEGLLATVNHERRETKNHIKVDFDLAVVLSQVDSTKLDGSLKASGEGKLKIAPFIKIGWEQTRKVLHLMRIRMRTNQSIGLSVLFHFLYQNP